MFEIDKHIYKCYFIRSIHKSSEADMKRYWHGVVVGALPWATFVSAQAWRVPYVPALSAIAIIVFVVLAMGIFGDWDVKKEWRRPQYGGNPHEVVLSEGASDFKKAFAVTQAALVVLGLIAFVFIVSTAP